MSKTAVSADPQDTRLIVDRLAYALFWAMQMLDTRWEYGEKVLEDYDKKYVQDYYRHTERE